MRALLPLALVAVVAVGCGGRPATTPPDGGTDASHDTFIPAPPSDQLDILFVIDNSNSPISDIMEGTHFAALIDALGAQAPSLSVQIGIVTTDLGAGVHTPPSCDTVGGDQGILQNVARGQGCPSGHLSNASDRFLRFSLVNGVAADENFVGGLDETLRCYAAVGTGGCGFEHVLGSMRAALDGCETAAGCTQHANVGFLRPDAYLAVIVMTDEDDCSAPADSTLFDPTQADLTSPLGPLTSYRCFEFGVLCGGADVGRSPGARTDCVPGNKDPNPKHQLVPVADFVHALKALKPQSPRMVYAATLAAPPSPVETALDVNGCPDLQPSCGGGAYNPSGDPGIRLWDFSTRFDADRGRWYDICSTAWSDAFAEIGADLATALQGD